MRELRNAVLSFTMEEAEPLCGRVKENLFEASDRSTRVDEQNVLLTAYTALIKGSPNFIRTLRVQLPMASREGARVGQDRSGARYDHHPAFETGRGRGRRARGADPQHGQKAGRLLRRHLVAADTSHLPSKGHRARPSAAQSLQAGNLRAWFHGSLGISSTATSCRRASCCVRSTSRIFCRSTRSTRNSTSCSSITT